MNIQTNKQTNTQTITHNGVSYKSYNLPLNTCDLLKKSVLVPGCKDGSWLSSETVTK